MTTKAQRYLDRVVCFRPMGEASEAQALKVETQNKRRELQNKLPALAMRVFALREKPYQGHGFHWGMEKSIGHLLSKVNDYDSKFDHMDLVTLEVLYEDLVERVDTAESE